MGVRNLRKKAQNVLKTKTKTKAKAKTKQTPNQKAFTKESNRIKKFISRAQKRGYVFPKSVLSLLEKPKQVRKSRIDKLKSLSATELYKKATFTNPLTGEVMTGTEGRKLERSLSAKKGWEKRKSTVSRESVPEVKTSSMTGRKMSEGVMRNPEIATLNYIIHSLESFAARANRKEQPLRLLNFIENAISQYGKSAVAQTIMDMDTPIPEGYDLYNEQRVTEYLNDFMFSLERLGYADMESILEISELKDEMQTADYDKLESNKFN